MLRSAGTPDTPLVPYISSLFICQSSIGSISPVKQLEIDYFWPSLYAIGYLPILSEPVLEKTSAVVLLFCLLTFPECWVVPLSLCLSARHLFWLQLPSLPLPSLLYWDFRFSVPAYTRWATPLSLFPSCSPPCFLLCLAETWKICKP